MKISKVHARQILDSRGYPTVECDVEFEDGSIGRAAVPSGASTGTHEALELRDGDPKIYQGKSVLKAVTNVNTTIVNALQGKELASQKELDEIMLQLDGTENKSKLGANAILAVSLAYAHASANAQKTSLFSYFQQIAGVSSPLLPVPQINIVNGGKHGGWSTDLQEYIILPIGAENFGHAMQMAADVFHTLGKVLEENDYRTTVGDEGGYAPKFRKGNEEPFVLISLAVEKAGYALGKDIVFGIDGAASEFYKDGKYVLKTENKSLSSEEMVTWLVDLTKKYPIVSLEDCLDQEDWSGWKLLTKSLGENIQIIGDDLFVTNIKFLEKGIREKSANAILIKLNQIGTVTETIAAVDLARKNGWKAIVSHRSGETEDTTIAHLVVGLATGQIKTGSLSRSERISKYNELLRIEELLGEQAVFAGRSIFHDSANSPQ